MRFFLFVLVLWFSGLEICADDVIESGVHFDPPAGFKPLSEELIRTKWPRQNRPKYAVGNKDATTTVAYDLKPHDLRSVELKDVRASFEQLFPRIIPGIEWINRGEVTINGTEWVMLEFSSYAIDTDIHNILMVTRLEDQMLVFNFNSTKEDFTKFEFELRESMNSIRLTAEP